MLRRSCESSDYDAPDTRILILQVSFGKSLSGSDLEQAGQGRCTHCCTRVYQQTSDCWFVGTGPDWRDARDECNDDDISYCWLLVRGCTYIAFAWQLDFESRLSALILRCECSAIASQSLL